MHVSRPIVPANLGCCCAMQDADNAENIAGEDGEAPVHEACTHHCYICRLQVLYVHMLHHNTPCAMLQDHTIVQAATGDKEDVNVELRALAEV